MKLNLNLNLRLEMYGRSYQWVIMGTYSTEWWNSTGDINIGCSVEEIMTALEATIMTDLLPLSTSGDITISGIVISHKKSNLHRIITKFFF